MPAPVWNQSLTNLRDLLADMYWDPNLARAKAREAGLNPSLIAIGNNPMVTWYNILDNARITGKVSNVIEAALKDYPDDPLLNQARDQALNAARGADISAGVQWQAPVEAESLEKLMGKQSTLMPISWLEAGLEIARSVVRVVRSDGLLGSGFVTGTGLLVTNNHVIALPAEAAAARVQFNYQKAWAGLDRPLVETGLAPDKGFGTSAADDWTGVWLEEGWQAATQAAGLKLSELPQGTPKKDDYTVIIQHPGGGPKQIALYHNVITYADATRVQYLTDTLPGSSGSPVFDTNWQVVALHHSGGMLREPGTKLQVYRNEGIHINAVLSGLRAQGLYG